MAILERVDNGTQAVQRCLRILECFTIEEPQLPLAAIAAQSGLAVSTTHRILKALQANEFVFQDKVAGTYGLGSAIMRLARVILYGNGQEQLASLAMPILRQLRNETGETAALYVRSHHSRLGVAEVGSLQRIRTATAVGRIYPLYTGAAGKAILAHLPPDEIESILDADDAIPPPPDRGTLLKDLETVRARGYATSLGETESGIAAVAAPVFWATDEVLAALTIVAPTDRLTKKHLKEVGAKLCQATALLSQQLGSSRRGAAK